ncbi:MAG: hypothetical protein ABSG43_28070 [Solirubrobacteraceae bacterium]
MADDAQWLDAPSAEALAFAARRLDSEGMLALFAMRESEPGAFEPAGLRALAIGGLEEEPARTLLIEHAAGRTIAPAVVQRLFWATRIGNPRSLYARPDFRPA